MKRLRRTESWREHAQKVVDRHARGAYRCTDEECREACRQECYTQGYQPEAGLVMYIACISLFCLVVVIGIGCIAAYSGY